MAFQSVGVTEPLHSGDKVRITQYTDWIDCLPFTLYRYPVRKQEFMDFFNQWKSEALSGPVYHQNEGIEVYSIGDPSIMVEGGPSPEWVTKFRAQWVYEGVVLCPFDVGLAIAIVAAITGFIVAVTGLINAIGGVSQTPMLSYAEKEEAGEDGGNGDGDGFDLSGMSLPLAAGLGAIAVLIFAGKTGK